MATIRKRKNGTYCVVSNYTDKEGKRRQASKTFKTEREAKHYKNEVEHDALNNKMILPSDITLKEFFDKWVQVYGKENWQYATYTNNLSLINNHILPELGAVKVQSITPIMTELFINQLKNKRTKSQSDKPSDVQGENKEMPLLSPTTVRHIYCLLKTAFDKAVEWQIIRTSPLIIKAPPRGKSTRTAWDAATVRAALDDIKHLQLHLAVHLSFICSLRIGEAMGLTWDCVDFVNNQIHINKTLQRVTKESLQEVSSDQLIKVFEPKIEDANSILILKAPKTEGSDRTIYLTEPLREELMHRMVKIQKHMDFLGEDFSDNDLVFCQDDGYPVEPKLCEKWFNKWQARTTLDVERLVFHEIRHSSTTYKLRVGDGDLKAVQGDTGHATAQMVYDVYAHNLDDGRKELLRKVESDFYSTTPTATSKPNLNEANMDDLVDLIQSNPDMQAKLLAALIGRS